jgi:hypothetical protein
VIVIVVRPRRDDGIRRLFSLDVARAVDGAGLSHGGLPCWGGSATGLSAIGGRAMADSDVYMGAGRPESQLFLEFPASRLAE